MSDNSDKKLRNVKPEVAIDWYTAVGTNFYFDRNSLKLPLRKVAFWSG